MCRKHASNKGDYDIGKREKNVNNHRKRTYVTMGEKNYKMWGRNMSKEGNNVCKEEKQLQ
jgi:hypothetical protein